MRRMILGIGFFMMAKFSYANTIAVIDSGLDYEHPGLSQMIWNNPMEMADNAIDDDNNGFVDDVRGWNFANNHAKLIDYDDEAFFQPEILRFLDIQSRALMGTATEGEKIWAKNKIEDGDFVKAINGYLTYAHGTHVAGIMTRGLEDTEVIDIRVIPGKPMEEAKEELKKRVATAISKNEDIDFIIEFVFKLGLRFLSQQQAKIFANIADYLVANNVRVANASIGMGYAQAKQFVLPILTVIKMGRSPSPELVDEYATFFLNETVKAQKEAFAKAPGVLFVFAAGNEGLDNDQTPTSPASVGLENTLAVGASIGFEKLAPFSNYGASSVDVFAPGVGILSFGPMERDLTMSGTSQAAPYVAGIASKILLANPKLTPSEVKSILMETVDRKGFLKGRSYTEGVVNSQRAVKAAELSLEMSIKKAIAESQNLVAPEQSDLIKTGVEPELIGQPILPRY